MIRRQSGSYGFESPTPRPSSTFSEDSEFNDDEFGGFSEFDEDDQEADEDDEFTGFGFPESAPTSPMQSSAPSPIPFREVTNQISPVASPTSSKPGSFRSQPPSRPVPIRPAPASTPVVAAPVSAESSPKKGLRSSRTSLSDLLAQEENDRLRVVDRVTRDKEEASEAQKEQQARKQKENQRIEYERQEREKKELQKKATSAQTPPGYGWSPSPNRLSRAQSTRPNRSNVSNENSPSSNRRFQSQHGSIANFSLLMNTMNTLRSPASSVSPGSLNPSPGADDDYEELDPKAIEAAKWTDKEIRRLIQVVKDEGSVDANGLYVIKFGKLFDVTANMFDALSGICKTAKKYHVLAYSPEQLWQGMHDNEAITLLKDHHDGIEIKKRRKLSVMTAPSALAFKRPSMANLNSQCHVCAKTVYPMEFVGASDKAFHKNCFRCATCRNKLSMNNYNVGRDGAFRCRAHHDAFERSNM